MGRWYNPVWYPLPSSTHRESALILLACLYLSMCGDIYAVALPCPSVYVFFNECKYSVGMCGGVFFLWMSYCNLLFLSFSFYISHPFLLSRLLSFPVLLSCLLCPTVSGCPERSCLCISLCLDCSGHGLRLLCVRDYGRSCRCAGSEL